MDGAGALDPTDDGRSGQQPYAGQQPSVAVQPAQGFPPQGFPPQGFPPQGYPAQGYPSQAFPGYPMAPEGARPAKKRGRWVLLAVGVVIVLVGGLYLASLGFQMEQDEATPRWKATAVNLPHTLLTFQRQPAVEQSPQLKAQLANLQAVDKKAQTYLGAYGSKASDSAAVIVIAYRSSAPMTASVQQQAWNGVLKGMSGSGASAPTLTDREPGPLGGHAACGKVEDAMMCVSVDEAVLMLTVGANDLPGGLDALASVRSKVETRA